MNKISLALVSILFLSSCQKEHDTILEKNTLLDQLLDQSLQKTSGEKGIDHFILPGSTDYTQIPQDKNNPLTDKKVALGKMLYHETGLALEAELSNGKRTYSCASCHHAQAGFQAGIRQGVADGGTGFGIAGEGRHKDLNYPLELLDVQPLRSPSTLNSAYQVNQLWNGQFGATGLNAGTESQWIENTPLATNFLGFEGVETQAIAGLSVHRMNIDSTILYQYGYKAMFDQAFPDVAVEERYSLTQTGLAIAAYERTLLANQAPFQRYLRGEKAALSDHQKQGAILFFGKAGCVNCHSGPALNSMAFYALGMGDLLGEGVHRNTANDPAHLGRGSFTGLLSDNYKFKVPQLYNLKDSPFYGHGGTFTNVYEVIAYKNKALSENPIVPDTQLAVDFQPLDLNEEELQQLSDFVENALYDPNLMRYVPEHLPSNLCFPNNDLKSRFDLNFNPL